MDQPEQTPIGQPVKVPVEWLRFDLQNPRFTDDKRPLGAEDKDVIAQLARTADLAELVQSISSSGYINIEPLVVLLRGAELVVLEGNRRLAAIKALRNPALAHDASLTIPTLSAGVRKTLEDILVYRVGEVEDARELIGFKHINGPQAWDAFAKATYAARWLDAERNIGSDKALQSIANRMGDKHATIHRMVTAYYVLQQAQELDVFRLDDRYKKSFSFSHLYTAISYEEFSSYLGMQKLARGEDPVRDPVPSTHTRNLKILLAWLYGSKSEDLKPVIRSQNPDLNTLRRVLCSRSATTELERTFDLDSAIVSATPKNVRFSNNLIEASKYLKYAMETLDGFIPEEQPELIDIAKNARDRSRVIFRSMEQAAEDQD